MINDNIYEIRRFYPGTVAPRTRFRVNGIGVDEIMNAGHVNRPAGTGDILLMFFPQPTEVGTSGGIITPSAPFLMIWPEGSGHYYGSTQGKWSHSWLHCSGQAIAPLLRETGLQAGHSHKCNQELINRYLRMIHAEMSGQIMPNEDILLGLFRLFLLETSRLNIMSQPNNIPEALHSARKFIERHYHEPVKLKDIAAVIHMSPSNLSAGFRRYFHTSPIDYAIELRLCEAEHLLCDHNRKLADIAEITGFRDQYYFNRLFTKKRGITPGEWRKTRSGQINSTLL